MKGRQLLRLSLQFMRVKAVPVALSAIDEERFGIRTARASAVTLETLPAVLHYCRDNRVVLLIARCLASELTAAQAMERHGFALMDTLVYYARDLTKGLVPTDAGAALVRPVRPGEEEAVKSVAAESFKGYFGHYHADPRLDPAKCDEAYTDWAYRSCVSREVADEVLVAVLDGVVAGFTTLRLDGRREGEILLFGVAPVVQRRAVSQSLGVGAMRWCSSKDAARLTVSTQITNVASQKVWTRLGFEPSHAHYTFHKWFDAS